MEDCRIFRNGQNGLLIIGASAFLKNSVIDESGACGIRTQDAVVELENTALHSNRLESQCDTP